MSTARLTEFKPALQYLLIDENYYTDTELASLNNLVAAVFRLEHANSPSAVSDLVKLLIDWLEDKLEGRQEGEALALQKLLAKRFGVIPVEITQQIANASVEQIEQWFDTAIDANVLTDVFKC